jgi:hypothetical protein
MPAKAKKVLPDADPAPLPTSVRSPLDSEAHLSQKPCLRCCPFGQPLLHYLEFSSLLFTIWSFLHFVSLSGVSFSFSFTIWSFLHFFAFQFRKIQEFPSLFLTFQFL